VVADPAGLSRVIANLLVNAIRHTPADGLVEVRGRAVPCGVELVVSDSCGGIAAPDLPRLFDVAWQGDAARSPGRASGHPHDGDARDSGAGLGLAIVKGIVEAHHGHIDVENLEAGVGCRFRVHLPAD
jgi:signal transduction histidine kinase